MQFACDLCGGAGHRANKCSTRYALDAAARDCGVTWEWGAAKSVGYYRAYVANGNNDLERELDAKAAIDRKIRKAGRSKLIFKKSSDKKVLF